MKILVTGGAGFIGSQVADAFIADQHEVVVLDNLSSGVMENVNSNARFVQADVGDDLEELFMSEKFDLVDHHAGQIDLRQSVADPIFDVKVNIIGSIKLLDLCRRYSVKKFIFASTGGAIYGEQARFPADENHPQNPLSPYGIDKLTVEKYMYWNHIEYGISCTALRYGNVYGPRQNPHGEAGVVAIFCDKMLNNINPVINGDGTQTRDFVFVEDVVRANLLALKGKGFDINNIGTGKETDINTIFDVLNKFYGNKYKRIHGNPQKGEQLRSVIDAAKAAKDLGWKAEVSLEQGLNRTAAFFRDRF